jgi:PAS domain S-box-containing protein
MSADIMLSDPVILEKEIADFKQAENALVQAQVKLAHMLSSSPAVIYSFDARGDHKPSFISDNFTEILGYERHEYLENPKFWEKCIHPEDTDRVMKAMPRLWEEGSLTQEYRFLNKDGTYNWVNDDMKLVRDENGEPREVVGSWSDIAERKEAELGLIQARDRLDHIMSTSPSVVYSFKATDDRTPTYISRNVTDLLGYEPREYLENPNFWIEKVHPDDLDRITNYLPRLFKEGRLSLDYRLQKKDKSYSWINDELVLRKDENGDPVEVIGSWSDITAKTQVGEALVSAQNRLSHLISFTPAVIYSFDVTGVNNATFVSENIKDLLGYEPSEYLDDRNFWVERLHPDDKDRILSKFPNLWETGMFEQEYRFRKKDGDYLWVNDQLRIVKDENDEAKEVVGAWNDITARKEAEAEVDASHARINHILSSSPAVLYSFEAMGDNNPTFVSENILDVFGYEPSDYLENRNFMPARIHPEDATNLERGFSRLFKEGHLINEYRFRHKDGSYRWVSDELRVIYDEAGKPVEIVGSWSDIAERKEAEAALSRQTSYIQLLEKIAVAANEASIIEDALQICLDEVCDLTGWPVGHVFMPAGDDAGVLISTKLWHLDNLGEFKTFKKITEQTRFALGIGLPGRVLSSGKAEWVNDVTKDTNFPRAKHAENIGVKGAFCFPVWIGNTVAAVLEFYTPELVEPDEQLLEVMANVGTQLGRVIERKQAEEELAVAKEKAEAANQAKTQFVSSISHEFRTPLNAVIGITEMLIEDAKDQDNKTLDEPLTRVHRAGKHLLSLINESLDISKIEAGKVDLHIKPFNISELIKDVTATVKPMLDTNHNTLEVKNMKEQEDMRSDSKRVMQILLNLLSNAAKFTENGSVTLKVKSANEGNFRYILFNVIDTGTGIPEDQIDNVFDEYSQVKSSGSSKYDSTGLGLGISRKLARIMGGDITVTSKYGEGSTFTAKLPVEIKGDAVQSHKLA